jgi:hypothetical protein
MGIRHASDDCCASIVKGGSAAAPLQDKACCPRRAANSWPPPPIPIGLASGNDDRSGQRRREHNRTRRLERSAIGPLTGFSEDHQKIARIATIIEPKVTAQPSQVIGVAP